MNLKMMPLVSRAFELVIYEVQRAAAIAAEQQKVQDDLNSAKVLPVVKLSIGYQF